MQVSLKSLEEMDKRVESARKSLKRAKDEAEATVFQVVQTAEVSGTAFALGIMNGRWESPQFLGIPVDLGVGLASHLLAFMDVAPEHLHNVGDGGLASYLSGLGNGIGEQMLVSSRQLPSP